MEGLQLQERPAEGIVTVEELPIDQKLKIAGSVMVSRAQKLRVSTQEEYEGAATFLKDIKEQAKRIKDYWAEPKAKAAAAHKDIVAREKAMLNPLAEAEAIVKRSMSDYTAAVLKARREAEEEARRRQQEEAERLLNQAIDAESAGDDQGAAIGLAMAEMVNDMETPPTIEAPKVSGITNRKTWKARVTDPTQVPAYCNGIELRTINMSALNSLAKMSKGTAVVPGVEFYEDTSIAVR